MKRPSQPGEIVVGPDIAVDHQERLIAEQPQRPVNPAAGFQGFTLGRIADGHAETAAVAQIVFDLLAEPGVVDHQFIETRGGQRTNVVLDQRHAGGANQRLRRVQRQRAQPLALAGGQNHRLHACGACGSSASSCCNSASSGLRASTASI